MAKTLPEETRLGYVTAWRTWRVWMGSEGPALHSVAAAPALGAWPPLQPMQARCAYREMRPPACQCSGCPDSANQCGIYAYREAPGAVTHATGIVGRVALWGAVIEHTAGYRSEWAYPIDVAYGQCEWCGTPSQPGLLPLEEAVALTPDDGAGWVVWTCGAHQGAALARTRSLETGGPSMGWAAHPGMVVARAVAAVYAVPVAEG